MNRDALHAIADAADALARLARAAANEGADRGSPDDLLPLEDAARTAATSVRVIGDAIRAGALPAYGRQRDRAVRRADLEVWIGARRVRPVNGPDDADLARRMRRLSVAGR